VIAPLLWLLLSSLGLSIRYDRFAAENVSGSSVE